MSTRGHEPIDDAIMIASASAALRELADGNAILAYDWPEPEWPQPTLPPRSLMEPVLQATGVLERISPDSHHQADTSAASSEQSSATGLSSGIAAVRNQLPTHEADASWTAQFVERAETMLGYYPSYASAAASEEGRGGYLAQRDAMLRWACRTLSTAKQWHTWAAGTRAPECVAVAFVMLLMAEGLWLIASAESSQEMAQRTLPDQALIARILWNGQAVQWLTDQGAGVPEWLDRQGTE
jgi:hypothetical protein